VRKVFFGGVADNGHDTEKHGRCDKRQPNGSQIVNEENHRKRQTINGRIDKEESQASICRDMGDRTANGND
jgi:hypothetical protein